MTEKEKMLQGKWYDANFDQELLQKRLEAKNYASNSIKQDQKTSKRKMNYSKNYYRICKKNVQSYLHCM